MILTLDYIIPKKMKQLVIYPIESINIGEYHYYTEINYYQSRLIEWEVLPYKILFHKDMSYGVSFIYKGYSHLFTYILYV